MAIADTEKARAILVSTRDGGYPESEEILTADVGESALKSSIQLVSESKSQIEADIRARSSKNSSNVDEWIRKAKSLQQEIEDSKAVAREIVRDHEHHQKLSAEAVEGASKIDLLRTEVLFNQALMSSLGEIGLVHDALEKAESSGYELSNFDSLGKLSASIQKLPESTAKRVQHKRHLALWRKWSQMLKEQLQSSTKIENMNGTVTFVLLSPVHAMTQFLQALRETDQYNLGIRTVSVDFYRRICEPLLSASSAYGVHYTTDPPALSISPTDAVIDARYVIGCLQSVIEFLGRCLPKGLGLVMGTQLMERLIKVLIRNWLNPTIPANLLDLPHYQQTLNAVKSLSKLVESCHWPGEALLTAWMEDVPQTWLSKRNASALDAVRKAFSMPRGSTRQVEKIERQMISKEEGVFAQNGLDDWNVDWSDEETKHSPPGLRSPEDSQKRASAGNQAERSRPSESGNETSEAWDWNDDEGDEAPSGEGQPPVVDQNTGSHPQQREVTLTELYIITDIPDHVLDIVSREIQDAESVASSEYPIIDKTSAAAGLSTLPSLALAMFRAVSPSYYASSLDNGNMHLYNDSTYMTTQLRGLARSTATPKLEEECLLLEKFARSAYAREMETQRTILGDLLDGAQGFVTCTRLPYSAGCDTAVSSTVDRLRAVHAGWKPTLTPSALLQSIGSLLSTVTEKIVKDVEDLEDISEPESQRLASYCSQISALENLFLPEHLLASTGEAESVPPTAVYVANWIRFQYLSNILESSLVDIKYLWVEGELSLEFGADEVVDLIEALFAESNHRRNAILEIRRTHTQRAS